MDPIVKLVIIAAIIIAIIIVIVKNIKVSGSTGGSFGSVTHGANVLGGSGTYTF